MGGGVSKQEYEKAQNECEDAKRRAGDAEKASKEVAQKLAAETQRANDAVKAKEEADQKLAEKRKLVTLDRKQSAEKATAEKAAAAGNEAFSAEEARRETTNLRAKKTLAESKLQEIAIADHEEEASLLGTYAKELSAEKALAESKLQEIADREEKLAKDQLCALKEKDASEAESTEFKTFDTWRQSFEDLGWGDDKRLIRQLFEEVTYNITVFPTSLIGRLGCLSSEEFGVRFGLRFRLLMLFQRSSLLYVSGISRLSFLILSLLSFLRPVPLPSSLPFHS